MRALSAALILCLLAACAGPPPAPVEERSTAVTGRQPAPARGIYRVRRGDTLAAIAFDHGLDYRDLARWNGLRAPYTIYPDQVLRLTAPPAPVRPRSEPVAKPAGSQASPKSTPSPPAAEPRPATKGPTDADVASGPVRWQWPLEGRLVRGFVASDPSRNGIDIAVPEGTSVRSAAGGRVVYSGNGLIGYGELIIVKHDEQWLSAYAHNQRRLVAEGETVAPGQVIAESGRNGRDEPQLHFEIRSHGRPVNPLDHLPVRR